MEKVLEPLIRSPRLPAYVRQLEITLAQEGRKRQAFYESMKEGDKVEFINGEVVLHSPVKLAHNDASFSLAMLLRAFVNKHRLGKVGHEKLMISLSRNDYEPDVCYWSKEKAAQFQPDQLRFPAPDFVAEVLSESTEAIDRGVKFEDYAAHEVGEYWIVDPTGQTVEQYLLEEGQYKLALKSDVDLIESNAIAGFAIPAKAIFDEAEHQRVLRDMLA
jgi:Uma2 family endonuclease